MTEKSFIIIPIVISSFLLLCTAICICMSSITFANDIDKQVEELLARMTLSEKIGQMIQSTSYNGQIPEDLKIRLKEGRIGSILNESNPETSLELQRIAVEESRLGIPLIMARDVIHGFRTIFPIPLGQAATWDPLLVEKCAAVAAEEAAMSGYHWTFAPMMDVARDPRWGRIAEGYGEDPYLASVMAAAMVRGFQGDDLSKSNTIAACAKHFVGYGAVEGGRDYNTTIIPEGILRDVYLCPFKAAVDAGVATVMTSFNEINGIPSSGNPFIIRKILREEWGFKGFVISDWTAMTEMINHGFCSDMKDVAYKSIHAGVDMEMVSPAYATYLEEFVNEGVVPQEYIDDAVRAILRIKFELGLFKNPSPYKVQPPEKPDKKALAVAKEVAMKSVVLLKNDKKILPLSGNIKSIAVIGPLANAPYEVLGTWSLDGKKEDTMTPLEAIKSYLGTDKKSVQLNFSAGLDYSRSKDKSGFADALKSSKKSDVVLFFGGEESVLSGEAHSRAYLNLPGAQEELISEISKTGKPVVMIVLAGRPLVIGNLAKQVQAVLYAWHPGTMCGPAITDLIFGIESPSGKLPVTFPITEGQIPVYYNHKNTGRPPREGGFTYMDDIPVGAFQHSIGSTAHYMDIGFLPLYPFGYGLSYTNFEYSNLKLSSNKVKTGEIIKVSVDLTNIGEMEADEIVQLYTRDLVGSLTRPVKELKGCRRIRLKPEETKTVLLDLPVKDLGFHNTSMKYVVEPGKFHLWVGGSSDLGLMTEFEVIE